MRNKGTVVLSCSVLAGMLAVAAGAGADQTCQAGSYTVSTPGPVAGASSTSITYTVSGNAAPDHVAAVVASGSTDCSTTSITNVTGTPATGNQAYGPGVGDPVTGLGKFSCHDEAAKINPNGSVVSFTITVSGSRGPSPRSVAVKKGNTIKACEIVGIGEAATVVQTAPVVETLTHGSCAVEFTLDRVGGTVLSAKLTAASLAAGCESPDLGANGVINGRSVEHLELLMDGISLGTGNFGDGYVQTGSSSCTTRIVGGRVYSWGAPCP
jgi:hypothetical protein